VTGPYRTIASGVTFESIVELVDVDKLIPAFDKARQMIIERGKDGWRLAALIDYRIHGKLALILQRELPVAATAEIVKQLREALREACDLADEANGDPSSCSYVVPIGERVAELRKLAGMER
jgi:hypothetical protein